MPVLPPFDAPNRQTTAQGHPTDWQAPPKKIYDMVVFGGGPAGLNAAFTAIAGGHTVALLERNLTGGTCVNFGCTPRRPSFTRVREQSSAIFSRAHRTLTSPP